MIIEVNEVDLHKLYAHLNAVDQGECIAAIHAAASIIAWLKVQLMTSEYTAAVRKDAHPRTHGLDCRCSGCT